MFEREDWTLFRSLETLTQKAGVTIRDLPKLVVKELVDNALDAGGRCQVELVEPNGFRVTDDGPGLDGDDQALATLFSVHRPLASSKLLRKPTRGALGNGLRVVAGAVLATGGHIRIGTRGRTLAVDLDFDTGESTAVPIAGHERPGTVVRVQFGSSLCIGPDARAWGRRALGLTGETTYAGKTSPHWYDSGSFFDLLKAAGDRTVRELIAEFDGCTGRKAGEIAGDFKGLLACSLGRAEADVILRAAQELARPVNPARLGCVGPRVEGFPAAYAKSVGATTRRPLRGTVPARLPHVLEAWAEIAREPSFQVFVNRTPITAETGAYIDPEKELTVWGCGLHHGVVKTRKPQRLLLNIQTPYMPKTTDGKAPDLEPLIGPILATLEKVARRAKRGGGPRGKGVSTSQKELIFANIPAAAAKAGGGGIFSQRQLYYNVRPGVLAALAIDELKWGTFCSIVTDYEACKGEDVPKMYRDVRGLIYHPHTGEEISLGTLAIEKYKRPKWTFNKILYCEKEGFFPVLRSVGWPERHDCALMTSKGFATRAARDVIDMLGESGEPIWFYCIHDADGPGTRIYQALQKATRARRARTVHVANLGLEPAEALALGLEVERVVPKKGKKVVVGDHVAPEWAEWLQTRRVELNAMTTPQFLAWLDGKFADQTGKVVPPQEVLAAQLEADVRAGLERRITRRILRRARIGARTEAAFRRRTALIRDAGGTIDAHVRSGLESDPARPWNHPVATLAETIARARRDPVQPIGPPVPQPSTPETTPC